MELNNKLLKDIYDCQIYLLDLGVSFEYTDTLSYNQLYELVDYSKEYREIINKRIESSSLTGILSGSQKWGEF